MIGDLGKRECKLSVNCVLDRFKTVVGLVGRILSCDKADLLVPTRHFVHNYSLGIYLEAGTVRLNIALSTRWAV